MHYEKLPKTTPAWLKWSVFIIGGCLGLSIGTTALLGLYGLSGFLSNLFYPDSLNISMHESAYLGAFGVVAAITAVMLSFLAYDMNILSKHSLSLSRVVWLPLMLTAALAYWQQSSSSLQYHVGAVPVVAAITCIVLGGIFPWLLLRTPAGRKLHNR